LDALFDLGLLSVICVPFFLIAAVEAEVISVKSSILRKLMWLVAFNPAVVAMGRLSYSTYLCHIPVLSIVVGSALLLTGNTSHAVVIGWTVLGLVLVAPISFLSYYWIEAPALELGRKYISGRTMLKAESAIHVDPSGHA
jgi:peptidoglycan/LPS O-acetylase OafA/YrhL